MRLYIILILILLFVAVSKAGDITREWTTSEHCRLREADSTAVNYSYGYDCCWKAIGYQLDGLIRFADLIDSISAFATIDSIMFGVNYSFGASGTAEFTINRVIADEEWYTDDDASWNYVITTSTTDWTAGTSDHSLTYTTTNQVAYAVADTADDGYVYGDIQDMVQDMVTAGYNYGFFMHATSGRAYYHTSDDENPPLLTIYGTEGGDRPHRRRRIINMGLSK